MDRAAQTAMLAMLADEPEIETDDSLEIMEEKIRKYLPVGKKIYRDERLSFTNSEGPAGQATIKAFKSGKLLNWLVKDSDQAVIENKDLETISYLRQAGNIAELIARYQSVGNNFNHLSANPDKQKEHGHKLERYLATHQGVLESFIAKVLEIQEGLTARDKFSEQLGNGWKETKGARIEIINDSQGQRIFINYQDGEGKNQKLLIQTDTIAQIIDERAKLEKLVNQA